METYIYNTILINIRHFFTNFSIQNYYGNTTNKFTSCKVQNKKMTVFVIFATTLKKRYVICFGSAL